MILVSLENVKKYSHVVARLPQRLKSTLFEIFSILRVPFRHPPFKKISNNVDFSLWGKQWIVPQKWDQNCEKSYIVCYVPLSRLTEVVVFSGFLSYVLQKLRDNGEWQRLLRLLLLLFLEVLEANPASDDMATVFFFFFHTRRSKVETSLTHWKIHKEKLYILFRCIPFCGYEWTLWN